MGGQAVSLCECVCMTEREREKSVSGWVGDVSVCLCSVFADPSVVRGGTSPSHTQADRWQRRLFPA